MLADLTPAQRALADFMSELSEDAWCAGWMSGLEFALWEVVVGGRSTYGWLTLSEESRRRLRDLSDACGGWIVFEDDTDETFVPLEEWQVRFASWQHSGDPEAP